MRATGQTEGRIVGHVQVKVASHVVSVPVQALPLGETGLAGGFFAESKDAFGIRIDSGSPESEQRQVIERATVEAAKFFSRKFLN